MHEVRSETVSASFWWRAGRKRRAGTENVPAIAGFLQASLIAQRKIEEKNSNIYNLKKSAFRIGSRKY